jgi:hypothetical protein
MPEGQLMKRTLAEREIAQSKRNIEEGQQLIADIEAGEFDDLIDFLDGSKIKSIAEVEREIAVHQRNIASWEKIMQEHPDLFDEA